MAGLLLLLVLGAPVLAPDVSPGQQAAHPQQQSAPSLEAASGLEARCDRLIEALDRRREETHVPGLAISVVWKGEVILARGLGLRDIQKDEPVTSETIFAIGSTTKAFTSTLIGMLVDEGAMSWDDPISRHLPWFDPAVDGEGPVTIRDALAHRAGFMRMGMLWANGRVTREEVLRTAARAEPIAPFRAEFHYNNVLFSAAGDAAGAAAGTSWEALCEERLLGPLGMKDSSLSIRVARRDSRFSRGYVWGQGSQSFEAIPPLVLTGIGPAGCINSSAIDMARWVRFQLAEGAIDGTHLVSPERLHETWTETIPAEGRSYGLGWYVGEVRGTRVVEHPGNIDGYCSQVGLFPDSDLGFCLLMNVSASPLQAEAANMILEAILPEPREREGAPATDHGSLVGRYVANFMQFRDAIFEVVDQGGRLAVDIPGQRAFALEPPDEADEDELWNFVDADLAVSFVRDEDGRAVQMNLHQAGLVFENFRAGYEPPPEVSADEVASRLGKYHHAGLKVDMEVLVRGGRLAIDIPGQMIYDLHLPDGEGRFEFRATEVLAVRFVEDAAGHVASLTFEDRGTTLECPRLESATAPVSAPIEDLLALRESDRLGEVLASISPFRIEGDFRLANCGVEGRLFWYVDGPESYRQVIDFGPFGRTEVSVSEEGGRVVSDLESSTELDGELLAMARKNHPMGPFGDWRRHHDSIRIVGADEVGGRRVHVVELSSGAFPASTFFADVETGDVLASFDVLGGGLKVGARFFDYREVEGLRVPARLEFRNEASGRSVVHFEFAEDGGFLR